MLAAETAGAAPPPAPARVAAEDELPSVYDLMQQVAQLQQVVRDIGGDDEGIFEEELMRSSGSFSSEQRTPPRPHRQTSHARAAGTDSFTKSGSGIYTGRKTGTNVANLSPYKENGHAARGELDGASGLKTPPTRRRETLQPTGSRTGPRPTRVAALTRENISLLPTPARHNNFTGSVCGSQKSRSSIRTDGGAVFSRLYQPDYFKNRDEKYKSIRDRRESLNCSFTPRTNAGRRDSISSRDSVGSGSQVSMQSAKTDVVNVSSRLYDPDYVKKRNARLHRMRQERELRECTFAPTINANASATPRRK